MSDYQYIKEIWAKNKRDPSIIMYPKSQRDGMFMVSLDGKSKNYKPYTEEAVRKLVNSTEFTKHSTFRMAALAKKCKENGNGYLPVGFNEEYQDKQPLKQIGLGSISDTSSIKDIEGIVDELTFNAIKTRRGQVKFRSSLIRLYGATCQITGSKVESVLEAAHIFPHIEETNYRVYNGLLLRSDIHTLFDLNLISLDEDTKIIVDESLLGTEYEKYNGKVIFTTVPEEVKVNLSKRALIFIE